MLKFTYISVFVLLLIGGCNRNKLSDTEIERRTITHKIQLVEATGGFVLMVGGETLTSDQVIESPAELGEKFVTPVDYFRPLAKASGPEMFKQRARNQVRNIVLSRISDMLLYQQAKREIGENLDVALKKQVEKAVREFIMDNGGDQIKADEELKKKGLDWKSFEEHQKKLMLIQWYVSKKRPTDRPLSRSELIDCYERIKDDRFLIPELIQFRLIDIQPDKMTLWKISERPKLAKLLGNRLLTRIKSGEDFSELAKKYSHGPMREFGGLWKTVKPDSLAAPYDKIAAAAEKIEPGQVSDLIITDKNIFIMKLEKKQTGGYIPFEQVQEQVRNVIHFERQNEVFEKANNDLLQQAGLSETGEFVDFCLDKIYQMKDRTVTVKRSIYKGPEIQKPKDTDSSMPGSSMGMPGGIRRR